MSSPLVCPYYDTIHHRLWRPIGITRPLSDGVLTYTWLLIMLLPIYHGTLYTQRYYHLIRTRYEERKTVGDTFLAVTCAMVVHLP